MGEFRNSDYGRMLKPPIERNGIITRYDVPCASKNRQAILTFDMGFGWSGCRKRSHGCFAEYRRERTILELSYHCGTHTLNIKPMLQRTPQGRVIGRHEKWKTIQTPGKARFQLFGKLRMSKKAKAGLSKQMAKGLNAHGRVKRSVGNHQINLMDCELRDELIGITFATYQFDRIRQF